ncbi:MAG: glutamate--tRNA ligase [Anaerolineae bacterium]|nr:glutamate--tRNA ligase [Anaerolineae bacterium]
MNHNHTGKAVRVRIAPSPTGNCHVGTARNALYNLLFARQRGGTFILRIDDTDARRSTQASEQGVLEGLSWLGLAWDEGPDIGGPFGPYRPSERLALYQAYAQRLLDAGRAYPCFCTPDDLNLERQQAQAAGVSYIYSGKCRHLAGDDARRRLRAGEKAVLRFHIDPEPIAYVDLVQGGIEQDGALIGDPIILRSSGRPVYSLATVVDEIEMQISHVLRSGEHINNTFPQLQMYQALGAEPPAFGHFSLLLNPDRSKISKRAGATYIGEFHDMGYLPETMINHLALSGWNPGTEEEFFTFDDLLARFSLERCSRANAIFDRTRLLWLNGVHIRRLDTATLARRVVPYLVDAGLLDLTALGDGEFAHLVRLVALEQERLKTLVDAPDALRFFFQDPPTEICASLLQNNHFARRHPPTVLRGALDRSTAVLKAIDAGNWAVASLEDTLDAQTDRLGWKRADLLMPIRIAISGREATPPLFETLACLGKTATLRRLEAAVNSLT